MPTTPILALGELPENAAGNYLLINAMLRRLEQAAALNVLDRNLTAPPGSPAEGDAYIVAATATGAWAGQDAKVAFYVGGAWAFIEPVDGMTCKVYDEKATFAYSGEESLWYPLQPIWSTTEYWTGRYGSGGTKAYGKCFSFALANHAAPANLTTAHGITNLNRGQLIELHASINNNSIVYKVPQAFGVVIFEMRCTSTNILCAYTGDLSAYTCQVKLEYERT